MRLSAKYVLCILLASFSIMMPAQNLPQLPKASNITPGALPNGVSYYLVTNTSLKGLADFALVQKGATDIEKAREALAGSSHFSSKTPSEFLASKGVGYDSNGFIKMGDNSTSFEFHDVPVFDNPAVDSTLMLIFDLVNTWPAEQAIIVAGDINVAAVQEKMKVLSMVAGTRQKSPAPEPYKWVPTDSATFRFIYTPLAKPGFVTAMYEFPRIPDANMNTAQPLVTQMFAREFGIILKNRLTKELRLRNIPLPSIDYVYTDSSAGLGNEHYTITLHTLGDSLMTAVSILASTLSDLDSAGASYPEYKDARDELISNILSLTHDVNNASYVRQCASAFLYGGNLADIKTVTSFFTAKEMDSEKELSLYNNFVSALLDKSRNLTLQCVGSNNGSTDGEELLKTFNASWESAWGNPRTQAYKVSYGDTLGLWSTQSKVKIKSEVPEPVSGGEVWTLSNGMKVIFKQSEPKNEIRYALMVRGGYSLVPGLGKGEGAFVSDMLSLYDVSGLQGQYFRKILGANGIVMNDNVSLSDMRITGSAPSSKLTLLLKALLSIANDRELNQDAFKYYKLNESLRENLERDGVGGIGNVLDSLMYPGYTYTSYRNIASLRDDLPQRAEQYFSDQFSRFNDGVLVVVGDVDPSYLKKLICRWAGGFQTSGKGFVPRPKIQYQPRQGTVTKIDDHEDMADVYDASVNLAISSQIPFSTDKYMAFRIAGFAIQKAIVRNLANTGMYVRMTQGYNTYPQENMYLLYRCCPADVSGLPSGMDPAGALDVLNNVRSAMNYLNTHPLSAAELNAYKSLLTNRMTSDLSQPEYVVDCILTRYSEGKDLISKYKERIAGITGKNVQEVLEALDKGSKVEYVVK